ncbi:MAG TPA: prolipoprotein diacylglyceryl transferase family protein [Caldilineaceae bacterium]|nr:prolipoprotein diacylglyceryl transferase family protein [Caldilineaceae bacterium]
MYPTLPFGPLSLPTGPVLAIFAAILALDVAGRYGRRLGLDPDDLWNVGLIALAVGLIVARLWNVFQFWSIYQAEPVLIFSLRPSGFEFWPGVVAAAIAGYLYLLGRALDPARVAAALAVGGLAGGVILSISGHATGAILGTLSDAPWALPYFGEPRHPVGLYRAVGLALLCLVIWMAADVRRPGRVIWLSVLGYSLLRLIADSFLQTEALLGSLRLSQVLALLAALVATLALARPLPPLPAPTPSSDESAPEPSPAPVKDAG